MLKESNNFNSKIISINIYKIFTSTKDIRSKSPEINPQPNKRNMKIGKDKYSEKRIFEKKIFEIKKKMSFVRSIYLYIHECTKPTKLSVAVRIWHQICSRKSKTLIPKMP